jgi:hypothetical protein
VKNSKNAEEALGLMTQAFSKLKDPTKLAALSAAAFGRTSFEMGQWLHEGTEEIAKQRQRFVELAGSKEKSAAAARRVTQAFNEMDVAIGSIQGALIVGLYPAFEVLSKAITAFLVEHRGDIAGWAKKTAGVITKWVEGGGIQRLVGALGTLASAVSWVVSALGGVENVALLAAGLFGVKIAGSVASAISALWTLGAAAIPVAIRGVALLAPVIWKLVAGMAALNLANPLFWIAAIGVALAAAAYVVWKYWEPIKKFFTDLWDTIKSILGVPAVTQVGGGPPLGSSHVVGGGAGTATGAAHVTVDFANMPRGARATVQSSNGTDVDLSTGYSMADAVGP